MRKRDKSAKNLQNIKPNNNEPKKNVNVVKPFYLHWWLFWFSFRIIFAYHLLSFHYQEISKAFFKFPTIHFSYFASFYNWNAEIQKQANLNYSNNSFLPSTVENIFDFIFPVLAIICIIQIIFILAHFYFNLSDKIVKFVQFCFNLTLFLGYLFILLSEKSFYNNHHYLYCLILFYYCLLPQFTRFKEENCQFALAVLQIQISIVYFYAGFVKLMSSDWIYYWKPIKIWFFFGSANFQAYFWQPIREIPMLEQLLSPFVELVSNSSYFKNKEIEQAVELVCGIFSIGSALLDLLGGIFYFLFPAFLAKVVLVFLILFHSMNSMTFTIGTFPVMMLSTTFLFWIPSFSFLRFSFFPIFPANSTRKEKLRTILIVCIVIGQIFIPLRFFVITDDVNWTKDGHFFAWRMMINQEDTLLQFIVKLKNDPDNNEFLFNSHQVDNYPLRLIPHQRKQMRHDPDMIQQFAREYIAPVFVKKFRKYSPDILEIYVNSWRSLNDGPYQRWISPDLDILYSAKLSFPYFIPSHSSWISSRDRGVEAPGLARQIAQYKKMFNSQGFEFVCFCDHQNMEWSASFANFADEIAFVLVQGTVELEINGRTVSLNEKDSLNSRVIPLSPQTRHFVYTTSEYSLWGYYYKNARTSFHEGIMM